MPTAETSREAAEEILSKETTLNLPRGSRAIKLALLGSLSLYYCLITLNNLTDYNTNFRFVSHVMAMDTVPPNVRTHWRAIGSAWSHHFIYIGIITWEALIAAGSLISTWKLARAFTMAEYFRVRRQVSIVLQFGLLFWLFIFIAAAGEWFLMWQSSVWNGEEAAFRMAMITAIVLFCLHLPE